MRTTGEVTLYDLMGDDLTVWIKKNKKFGFDLEIEDMDGEILVYETEIHKYSMESFADFCRSFVYRYERLIEEMAKEEEEKMVEEIMAGEE